MQPSRSELPRTKVARIRRHRSFSVTEVCCCNKWRGGIKHPYLIENRGHLCTSPVWFSQFQQSTSRPSGVEGAKRGKRQARRCRRQHSGSHDACSTGNSRVACIVLDLLQASLCHVWTIAEVFLVRVDPILSR